MKRGFTLLELIVVIIIVGILGTLGFSQYGKVVEKGRTAEAKAILGQLRTAEAAYYQEYNAYVDGLTNLPVSAPSTCVGNTTHYFSYTVAGGASTFTATATRCTSGGKTPTGPSNYTITMTEAGNWGGTGGYY